MTVHPRPRPALRLTAVAAVAVAVGALLPVPQSVQAEPAPVLSSADLVASRTDPFGVPPTLAAAAHGATGDEPSAQGDPATLVVKAGSSPVRSSSRRSMWVWYGVEATGLVTFAKAHKVTRLYVHVPSRPSPAYRTWVRGLRAQAQPAGITLWALGSDPSWITTPALGLQWQRDALSIGVFAGTHLDVEPHADRNWAKLSVQRKLVSGYLTMLTLMQKDSKLPLEVDLPFWAGQVPAAGPDRTWADGALARADGATAMTYRDTPAGILSVGQDMLRRGGAHNKPVELAAETDPLSDCSYCTFYEEGAAKLETTLQQVARQAQSQKAFAGISVHRYLAWKKLR